MAASARTATGLAPTAVRQISREFIRYIIAGIAATLADYAVLTLLIELFRTHYLLANTCSFIAASAISYLLSIVWVFRTKRKVSRCREFIFFTLIGVGGLLISHACMFVMIEFLNHSYHFGKIAAVGGTLFWNFGVKKALLFRSTF